jgi:hypothetical protein
MRIEFSRRILGPVTIWSAFGVDYFAFLAWGTSPPIGNYVAWALANGICLLVYFIASVTVLVHSNVDQIN